MKNDMRARRAWALWVALTSLTVACEGSGAGQGGAGGAYEPAIAAADFGRPIDNPFMPLVPGTMRVYESQTTDGLEHVEIRVTGDTKTILGVPCVVVEDTLRLDGVVNEQTKDWFTQDVAGNVWYFGESTTKLEDDGTWTDEGSWEGGVDGAMPGIAMEAHPAVGDIYRQEFSKGHAEDMAEVLSLTESASVPFGSFEGCIKTRDYTPLEPGPTKDEFKYYCSGVGEVLTIEGASQELRSELLSLSTN